jgi:tetratricopeptide (TPR) repeat protein
MFDYMKNLLLATAILCCFDAFSQANSDSANFYFNKGELEKTARRMLLANEAFDKAIAFNPQYTEAYLANAQVLLDMRRTDKALQNFTKLHELQPANKEAIKELMELSFNYRQYDKAIAFAKNVLIALRLTASPA